MSLAAWLHPGRALAFSRRAAVAPDRGLIRPRPAGPDGQPIGDDVQLYVSPEQLAVLGWCALPFVLVPVTMLRFYVRFRVSNAVAGQVYLADGG